jgi:ABC-type transporter Mla subunit MlaD
MSDRKHIVVGLFVLGGLVLLGVLVMWFEGMARFVRTRYEVRGHLPSSIGVRAGKRVHKDGMEVGDVVDVVSSLPERPGVWVHMRIDQDVAIPAEAQFIAQQMTMGDIFLDFETKAPSTKNLPKDGSARLEGLVKTPSLLPEDMLEDVREGIATLKRLEPLSKSLEELVAPRTVEEVAAGEKPANLSSAVKQFQTTAKTLQDELEDPKSGFGQLLASAQGSAAELSKTLTDARTTFASIRETAEVYQKSGTKANEVMEKASALADQLKKDADEAQKLLANVGAVVDGVRQGKGTLGKLVADDELHLKLVTLIENLEAVTDNANRLMTLWREQGVLAKEK